MPSRRLLVAHLVPLVRVVRALSVDVFLRSEHHHVVRLWRDLDPVDCDDSLYWVGRGDAQVPDALLPVLLGRAVAPAPIVEIQEYLTLVLDEDYLTR